MNNNLRSTYAQLNDRLVDDLSDPVSLTTGLEPVSFLVHRNALSFELREPNAAFSYYTRKTICQLSALGLPIPPQSYHSSRRQAKWWAVRRTFSSLRPAKGPASPFTFSFLRPSVYGQQATTPIASQIPPSGHCAIATNLRKAVDTRKPGTFVV